MSFAHVIKQRHLITLWASQVLSAIGDQLYAIAIIWLAVQEKGAAAGFVAASGSIAGLLLGLVAGVYADRWDRQITMITADLLRAAVVLSLVVIAHFMPLAMWQMGLASFLVSALTSLFDPALQASLPELAPEASTLQAMNALMLVNHRLGRMVGPGIAGLLVSLVSIHHFFTIDAFSFIISALAILSIGRRYRWKAIQRSPREAGISGVLADICKGARLVRDHERLLWALCIYLAGNFAWSIAYMIGFPLLAKQLLGDTVGTYGMMVASYGLASVLSNFVMGFIATRRHMLAITTGNTFFCFGFLIVAGAQTLPIACAGCAFAATGGPVGDLMLIQMIQSDMPREDLGKVYSLRAFVSSVGCAIGLLLAPAFYSLLSASVGIGVCGIMMGLLAVIGLWKFGLKPSPRVMAAPSYPTRGTVADDGRAENRNLPNDRDLAADSVK
jgi:MFS family permease